MLKIIAQQSEPFLEGGSENLALVVGGFAIVAIVVVLLLLLFLRRRRLARTQDESSADLQARFQDVVSSGNATPPPQAEVSLSPIEAKLRQAEAAEAAEKEFKRVSLFSEPDASASDTSSPFASGDSSPLTDFEALDDSNTSFSFDDLLEPEADYEADLSYLFGDDEPEAEPVVLDTLNELDTYTFLSQVNKFRLKGKGQISEQTGEMRLSWQMGINNYQIRIVAVNETTIEINGDYFPATQDGLKQGIVTTFKNKNY